MVRTFEKAAKIKLQDTLDMLYKKLEIKPIDITFKYMAERSIYLEKGNMIFISKDYLENFYFCLALKRLISEVRLFMK